MYNEEIVKRKNTKEGTTTFYRITDLLHFGGKTKSENLRP